MAQGRINIPKNIISTYRPGFCGRRFATEKTELGIRQANEEREARLETRSFRQNEQIDKAYFDTELKKVESVVKLRDFLLQELAKHENALNGQREKVEEETYEKMEQTLERVKYETVEALRTLV